MFAMLGTILYLNLLYIDFFDQNPSKLSIQLLALPQKLENAKIRLSFIARSHMIPSLHVQPRFRSISWSTLKFSRDISAAASWFPGDFVTMWGPLGISKVNTGTIKGLIWSSELQTCLRSSSRQRWKHRLS